MRAAALTLLALVLAAPAASGQVRDLVGVQFQAHVVSVVDGDTLDAIPAGETRAIRIRLEGVDAPERGEPFSDAARRLVRTLLFDQRARLEGRDVDRYGRLVARVSLAGSDTSVALVAAGLACHYTQYSTDSRLAEAERQAQRLGNGFWAAGVEKPRCTRAAGTTTRGRAPARRAQGPFHGNTDNRVYHAATCRNFNCRNCTRVFRSRAEAEAAGYKPAGDCLTR